MFSGRHDLTFFDIRNQGNIAYQRFQFQMKITGACRFRIFGPWLTLRPEHCSVRLEILKSLFSLKSHNSMLIYKAVSLFNAPGSSDCIDQYLLVSCAIPSSQVWGVNVLYSHSLALLE